MSKSDVCKKWLWMMDYCKKYHLAPAVQQFWDKAEKAYQKQLK